MQVVIDRIPHLERIIKNFVYKSLDWGIDGIRPFARYAVHR